MKSFARWRLKVWNRRLSDRQHKIHEAIALSDHDAEMAAERAITEALAKKVRWRRRVGR